MRTVDKILVGGMSSYAMRTCESLRQNISLNLISLVPRASSYNGAKEANRPWGRLEIWPSKQTFSVNVISYRNHNTSSNFTTTAAVCFSWRWRRQARMVYLTRFGPGAPSKLQKQIRSVYQLFETNVCQILCLLPNSSKSIPLLVKIAFQLKSHVKILSWGTVYSIDI